MYKDLIKSAGLTENESKIYLTLLKIGISTTSKIVKDAKVSGGKIYETLDKLYQKGLVSVTEIKGVKNFQTTSPQALITYIKEKKKKLEEQEIQLEKILPELFKMQQAKPTETSVNMIIGQRSIKPLMNELFTNAKEIYAMGLRGSKKKTYNNFWWHLTTQIANKKEKNTKYLFTENKSEYYKEHLKLKNINVKSIKTVTPIALDIIDDHVLIFSYGDDFTCVHITNKDIADSFRAFFMNLWEQAS